MGFASYEMIERANLSKKIITIRFETWKDRFDENIGTIMDHLFMQESVRQGVANFTVYKQLVLKDVQHLNMWNKNETARQNHFLKFHIRSDDEKAEVAALWKKLGKEGNWCIGNATE